MIDPGALRASFTTVRYTPWMAAAGAWHMAAQRVPLRRTPGLRLGKLLGAGSGIGFSKKPDFTTWALFTVWETEDDWAEFQERSRIMRQYRSRGEEVYTVLLRPISAHGHWDGIEPFGTLPESPPGNEPGSEDEPVAVLTRATVRFRRQLRFWSAVEPVGESLRDNRDLLLTFGVGEVPYLRQATFSVWRTPGAMRRWAYGSAHHRTVIRRTREEGWYAEELFARFRLVRTYGTWGGSDPLAAVIPRTPGV